MSHPNTEPTGSRVPESAAIQAVVGKVAELANKWNASSGELSARLHAVEQIAAKRDRSGPAASGPSLGRAVTEHERFSAVSELANSRGRVAMTVKAAMITTD